jgi:hypothetical protein
VVGLRLTTFDRRAEAIDQKIAIQRLYQKADGPVIERTFAHVIVGYGRNEYERHSVTLLTQIMLELNAVHRLQTNVGNYTPNTVELRRVEEVFRGLEGMRRVSDRRDKIT